MSVEKRIDYNSTEWDANDHEDAANQYALVTDIKREGTTAGKRTVRAGDDGGNVGERAEGVWAGSDEQSLEGSTRYYGFSTFLDPAWQVPSIWGRLFRWLGSLGTTTLTVSGNEITDASRTTDTEGDARPRRNLDFMGGFETGDRSEWTQLDAFSEANQFAVITSSPTPRDGTYAGKATVRSGDVVASGERCEWSWQESNEVDGDEYWYGWSSYFPSTFVSSTSPTGFKIFTQFHDDTAAGQPCMDFRAKTNELILAMNTGALDASDVGTTNDETQILNSLPKDVWLDFLVHVVWRTGSTGAVEVWYKLATDTTYTQKISRTGIPTLQSTGAHTAASKNYVKQGLYRSNETYTESLYHDHFRRGRNRVDVETPAIVSADGSFGIWAGSTNKIANGNVATNTSNWPTNGAGVTLTRETTSLVFGSTRAKVVTPGTGTSEGVRPKTLDSLAEVGKTYVGSAFAQGTSGETTRVVTYLRISYTDTTAVNGPTTVYQLTNYPTRLVTAPITADAAKTVNNVRMAVETTIVAQARTFYLGGVQIEEGVAPTPYIHTDGFAVSRSAARVQLPAMRLTPTRGWIAARVRVGYDFDLATTAGTGLLRILDWPQDASNYIRLYYDESARQFKLERRAAGISGTHTFSATFPREAYVTVLAAWTDSNLRISINGAAFTQTADTNIPAALSSSFDVGSSAGTASHLNGDVMWLATGLGELTDTDATMAYGYFNSTPPLWAWSDGAIETSSWPADTSTYYDATFQNGPVSVDTVGSVLSLNVKTGVEDPPGTYEYEDVRTVLSTLPKGVWIDWLMTSTWQKDFTGAFKIELRIAQSEWKAVLDVRNIPTLVYKTGPTLADLATRIGLFRNAESFTNVQWDDLFLRGTTRADISGTVPESGFWTNDPTRNGGALTTHNPTITQAAGTIISATVATANASSPAVVTKVDKAVTVSTAPASAPAAVPVVARVTSAPSALGIAPAPAKLESVVVSASTALGLAPGSVVLVTIPVAVSTALGIAPTATAVVGSSGTTVPVSAASALGLAPSPLVLITVPLLAQTALGSAPAPADLVRVFPVVSLAAASAPAGVPLYVRTATAALALGLAPSPSRAVVIPLSVATALGIAPAPTVIAGSGATVIVSASTALASAPGAAVLVVRSLAAPSSTGSTGSTQLVYVLSPGAASALGIAPSALAVAGALFILTGSFDLKARGRSGMRLLGSTGGRVKGRTKAEVDT